MLPRAISTVPSPKEAEPSRPSAPRPPACLCHLQNLRFFAQFGMREGDGCDYIVVIQEDVQVGGARVRGAARRGVAQRHLFPPRSLCAASLPPRSAPGEDEQGL